MSFLIEVLELLDTATNALVSFSFFKLCYLAFICYRASSLAFKEALAHAVSANESFLSSIGSIGIPWALADLLWA